MFELRENDNGYVIIKCSTHEHTVIVPAVYEGKPIVNIDAGAFNTCMNTINLIIEAEIYFLPKKVFANCPIKNIIFKYGLFSFPKDAFLGSSVESISIPSLIKIDARAFKDSKLSAFNFPNSIDSIDSQVFSGTPLEKLGNRDGILFNYNGLDTVLVTQGISTLLPCSFSESDVSTVIIAEETQRIYGKVFMGNSKLKRVEFYNTLLKLPENLFLNCSSLTSVKLPNKLQIICKGSFAHTVSLTNIQIPETVQFLEDQCFTGSGLEEFVGEGVLHVGDFAFESCKNLKSVHLGKAEKISSSAFNKCSSLERIYINRNTVFKTNNPKFKIFYV